LSRLVVVSNRVALPGEGAQRSGGLVTGLVDALHQAGGLWFGWSGKLGETAPEPIVFETEDVTYATVDLTRADHDSYYSSVLLSVVTLGFVRSSPGADAWSTLSIWLRQAPTSGGSAIGLSVTDKGQRMGRRCCY
jgi:hypothetical protein